MAPARTSPAGSEQAALVRRRLLWALDVVVAVAAAYFAVLLTVELSGQLAPTARNGLIALAALHGGALALRRRWPVPVLGVVLATGLLYSLSGLGVFRLGPAVYIAMYTVASRTARRTGVAALVAGVVTVPVAVILGRQFRGFDTPVLYLVMLIISWFLG